MGDVTSWFAGKRLTSDWTSGNFDVWRRHIGGRPVASVLEIGSWEGRSAIFFLEYCAPCSITCIDTFAGAPEHADMPSLSSIEQNFDANLAPYGARVEKIKSGSLSALTKLVEQNRTYDLVYVDGSHARDDVLVDSVLGWRLLALDGLMIWDDYRWGAERPDHERPQRAVEAFLSMHADEIEIVHVNGQVLARKRLRSANVLSMPGLRAPRTLRNTAKFIAGLPLDGLRSV